MFRPQIKGLEKFYKKICSYLSISVDKETVNMFYILAILSLLHLVLKYQLQSDIVPQDRLA